MLPRREYSKMVSVFGYRDALSQDDLSVVVVVFLALGVGD